MKRFSSALAGLTAAATLMVSPAMAESDAQGAEFNTSGLAAQSIADGKADRAIVSLRQELEKHPSDPALLINLGIALAHNGQDAAARDSFQAALESGDVMELATAGGELTDSRDLARRAIAMLDRGEFRRLLRNDQFAQRD